MEFIQVIGYAAIGLSTCFYICLSIPFVHVLRCKQNFEFTPIGLINTVYVDCVAWYIYGNKLSCDEIMLGHKIGACCSLLLIIIYLAFEIRKYLIDTILNALILILGTLVLHKGLTMVIEDSNIVGKICIGTKLITFCIPMLEMSRVFKDKNYKHISLHNTLFCCAACLAWAIFGKCANDINAICANCLAVVLCLVQLGIRWNYKRKYANPGEITTIGIESTGVDDSKKEEKMDMNVDEESQDKAKEKPVRIVTKI